MCQDSDFHYSYNQILCQFFNTLSAPGNEGIF